MRILVITSAPPRDDHNTMGIQQTFHRLRFLAQEHNLAVAFSNQAGLPEPQTSPQEPFRLIRLPTPTHVPPIEVASRSKWYWMWNAWKHTLFDPVPHAVSEQQYPILQAAIAQVIRDERPEIVHVIGEPMLYNTPRHTPNLLADFPDLYSNLFRRLHHATATRRTHEWQNAREMQKLELAERRLLTDARCALFVSETDRASALRIAPTTNAVVIPNAVDLEYFAPATSQTEPCTILFTGTLSYYPNVEALQFFGHEIFPRILQAIPEARFEIVGYKPAQAVLDLANAHIQVVPDVPDIRPYLERATICIAPLRNGSGTRIKIIEAWAMEKAVVATHIGAEGLDCHDGEQLLLADEPNAFADAVIALLRDSARRQTLAKNGRTLVNARYSLHRAAEQLNRVYADVTPRIS